MKIEKLSDNQIRCTLKKSDLASRHLKISELAYGSEKAKELFRDIMKQASYEFGFEADDIPLMIEAIPISADCIVLIVTKVEDPDELDTRFSKFSPEDIDGDDFDYGYPFEDDFETLSTIEDISEPAADEPTVIPTASDELDIPTDEVTNDVLSLFNKVRDYLSKNINDIADAANNSIDNSSSANSQAASDNFVPLKDSYANSKKQSGDSKDYGLKKLAEPIIRMFVFNNFNTFNTAAAAVKTLYNDKNTLYKDSKSSVYYLVLEKNVCSPTDFNKTCNILSEYAIKENADKNRISYFNEHYECIIRDHAIQVAASL